MQVNVAIMMAPVTFLGHITSQPVEAMARLQADQVIFFPSSVTDADAVAAYAPVACAVIAAAATLSLLLYFVVAIVPTVSVMFEADAAVTL